MAVRKDEVGGAVKEGWETHSSMKDSGVKEAECVVVAFGDEAGMSPTHELLPISSENLRAVSSRLDSTLTSDEKTPLQSPLTRSRLRHPEISGSFHFL